MQLQAVEKHECMEQMEKGYHATALQYFLSSDTYPNNQSQYENFCFPYQNDG